MAEVLLFSTARVAAGVSRVQIDAPSIAVVAQRLAEDFGPAMSDVLKHCSFMVDGERAPGPGAPLSHASEVAVLPPVSGG